MAASNDRIPLMEWMVRVVETQKPVLQVEYETGEVVSNLYSLVVPSFPATGTLLRVPTNTAAVVTFSGGQQVPFNQGDHYLDVIPGVYYYKCVNLQQQHMQGVEIKATSKDAYDIILKLDIFWQVRNPVRVLRLQNVQSILRSAVQAATSDFIRSMLHDEIIQVAGASLSTVSSQKIAEKLMAALQRNVVSRAVDVLGIYVQDRRGDRRRTDVIQQSIVEQTQIDQFKQLEIKRTELEALRLTQQEGLLKQKETLAVQEANIDVQRTAVAEQARLVKADIAREEANRLASVRMQEINFQRQADLQRMKFELRKQERELRYNAISQLASLMMQCQTNGFNRNMEPAVQQTLVQIIREVVQSPQEDFMPEQESLPESSQKTERAALPRTLRERVALEIVHLYEIEGVSCEALEDGPDNTVRVRVNFKGLVFTIECGEEFPQAQPRKVLVQAGGSTPQVLESQPEWAQGITLANYLMVVFVLITSQAKAARKSGSNNGHNSPTPEKAINKEG